MKLSVDTTIEAPRERVWQIISDIENSERNISAIEQIEVLEKPDSGPLHTSNLVPGDTGSKMKKTGNFFRGC